MSAQTSWMISLGLAKVPPKLFMPRKTAFIKISFDKTNINAERKSARKRLIESIMEMIKDIPQDKREVKETNEEHYLKLTKKDMLELIEHIKLGGQLNHKIAEFIDYYQPEPKS